MGRWSVCGRMQVCTLLCMCVCVCVYVCVCVCLQSTGAGFAVLILWLRGATWASCRLGSDPPSVFWLTHTQMSTLLNSSAFQTFHNLFFHGQSAAASKPFCSFTGCSSAIRSVWTKKSHLHTALWCFHACRWLHAALISCIREHAWLRIYLKWFFFQHLGEMRTCFSAN